MSWFTRLTGVDERSAQHVREHLEVRDGILHSKANGKSWKHGRLEIPTLKELESRVAALKPPNQGENLSNIRLRAIQADVAALHKQPDSAGCVFQVASQFNLLEMVHPGVTPDAGIGIYERDRTQGPICAISAGAGTIYRQYFVEIDGRIGQTASRQVNCLKDMAKVLEECSGVSDPFWKMENGYCLPSEGQLSRLNEVLEGLSPRDWNRLLDSLRVGVQWDTEVTTLHGVADPQCVTQVYSSALPVSYSRLASTRFRLFASIVLEATYRATLAAGVLNAYGSQSKDHGASKKTVYLTLVGGGAFGNEIEWILSAIRKALVQYQAWDLDVVIVSYQPLLPDGAVMALVDEWSRQMESIPAHDVDAEPPVLADCNASSRNRRKDRKCCWF